MTKETNPTPLTEAARLARDPKAEALFELQHAIASLSVGCSHGIKGGGAIFKADGWMKFVEDVAEMMYARLEALAAPLVQPSCTWKDCPHGAECVHAQAQPGQVEEIIERAAFVAEAKRRGWTPGDFMLGAYAGWLAKAGATPPAAQAGSADTDRLDWLMWRISGAELRRIGVVKSAGGQFIREAIDRARAAEAGEGASDA